MLWLSCTAGSFSRIREETNVNAIQANGRGGIHTWEAYEMRVLWIGYGQAGGKIVNTLLE